MFNQILHFLRLRLLFPNLFIPINSPFTYYSIEARSPLSAIGSRVLDAYVVFGTYVLLIHGPTITKTIKCIAGIKRLYHNDIDPRKTPTQIATKIKGDKIENITHTNINKTITFCRIYSIILLSPIYPQSIPNLF